MARLQTERCALWGLVESGFARQRCVAAALADHDPAALPVSPALLQVLHVPHLYTMKFAGYDDRQQQHQRHHLRVFGVATAGTRKYLKAQYLLNRHLETFATV